MLLTDLGKRIAVAVALLPPLAVLLWSGGVCSAGLFALAGAVGAWEYLRLAVGRLDLPGLVAVVAAGALPLLPTLLPDRVAAGALFILGGLSATLWALHVVRGPRDQAPTRVGHMIAAVIFSSVGLLALALLRAGADGLGWVTVVLAGSWGNDTAAYFGGKAIGRNKLLPLVSPHKTWEGAAVGLLGGVAGVLATKATLLPELSMGHAAALGTVMGVLGPMGDLSKSMLKRAYHVKDAGRIFPGHGGMLDRIDSVIFNAPAVLVYRLLMGG